MSKLDVDAATSLMKELVDAAKAGQLAGKGATIIEIIKAGIKKEASCGYDDAYDFSHQVIYLGNAALTYNLLSKEEIIKLVTAGKDASSVNIRQANVPWARYAVNGERLTNDGAIFDVIMAGLTTKDQHRDGYNDGTVEMLSIKTDALHLAVEAYYKGYLTDGQLDRVYTQTDKMGKDWSQEISKSVPRETSERKGIGRDRTSAKAIKQEFSAPHLK